MDKAGIRKIIKREKDLLTEEQIWSASHIITERVVQELAEKEWKIKDKKFRDKSANCKTLYCYVSYNQEILTADIMEAAWKLGYRVAVPKIHVENGTSDENQGRGKKYMQFYYIDNMSQLESGYYGILEPTTTERADADEIFMIMPGVAFDRNGNRIGYGGGFYDKYLDVHRDRVIYKLALAYDFQIIDEIQTDEHDYKVDTIVTPSEIIQL